MFEKKHIFVDMLPRIFWLIQFGFLAMGQWLSGRPTKLTENVLLLTLGITLTAVGSLLNAWTVKHLVRAIKTRQLIQTGPYRYIRHPMYVFIYITLIGVGMLWFSTVWFIILLLFSPVWYWIGRKEEEQMIEITDGKYQDYRKRTGMFLPKLWQLTNP
jgi:protein-S-isoprenylcysteine O-methyltransferase Ste14